MQGVNNNRSIWAWAAYDWANSAFATTVMAGFFPAFFRSYWHVGAQAPGVVTWHLGVANSVTSIVIALSSPILGAIADRGGMRKKFLLGFALLGVVMTGGLFFVARGQWFMAAVLYVLAGLGFFGGNIFYDSLLPGVASADRRDGVSALGFALGYLGGGVLFAVNVAMVARPGLFGLGDKATAIRVAFLMVAAWWLLFTVPLALLVPAGKAPDRVGPVRAIRDGLRQFRRTLGELRRQPNVWLFLLAYWFYIDGVDTVIRMAVDYGKNLGFADEHLMLALLITQFVGFPAALVFGWLGRKWGTRKAIVTALGVYVAITLYGAFMNDVREFFALAVAVGLVQGGVQALSRSFFSRLIPAERAGEFFGFYNMLGKAAAIIGPPMMGLVTRLSGSPRAGIASIVVLFVIGGGLFLHVRDPDSPPIS